METLINPKWPPNSNSFIKVIDPLDNKEYFGTFKTTIWNSTAGVIELYNYTYKDNSLNEFPQFNYGQNHFLLLPTYKWSYESKNDKNLIDFIINPTDKTKQNIVPKVFNNLQYFKTNIKEITKDMIIEANNPYYKPLLSSNGVDFSEINIDKLFSSNFKPLSDDFKKSLLNKLKSFDPIKESDVKLPVNQNIAINNLITDPDDELNEGNRIIKLINKMIKPLFPDIYTKIHAGYVFFFRQGIKPFDVITKDLVPNLNYFKWQDGKPIDYHVLKYVIYQNKYQQSIKENLLQKSEAESIIGVEYSIAIQCKSEFLLWCLKRIIMIWYSDPSIEHIIRKIKVLINHYRADPFNEFNKINGILPMIIIYPKYGIHNARLLISKLEYYFSLYIEDNKAKDYQEIYLSNSNPTYFIKKNNLLYYTNGSLDLKMYIKESLNCDENIVDNTFNDKMSKIISSKNIIAIS